MYNKAVKRDPWSSAEVPDHFKTQEMCNKAVEKYPLLLLEVADHLKAHEMCNKAVEKCSWLPKINEARQINSSQSRKCALSHGP